MGRNSGIPHYVKIADAILASLKSGEERRLPSQRAIAQRYKVARSTAVRALSELRKQGYVNAIQGSGTFTQKKSARIIFGFGYLLNKSHSAHFTRFFAWLEHRLAKEGLRLIVRDIGLQGELIEQALDQAEVARAELVIWYAPSHPDGIKAATRARRHFPHALPMVLINDPLGLALQGEHRFDLVHHDLAVASRQIVQRLAEIGSHHPVRIQRSDSTLFAEEDSNAGFLAELRKHGITDPDDHVIYWDMADPWSLKKQLGKPRSWRPSAMIIGYTYEIFLRQKCEAQQVALPANFPIYAFGADYPEFRLTIDFRDLAEVCADLALSRLSRPSRQNLRVAVNIPVRARRPRGKNEAPPI